MSKKACTLISTLYAAVLFAGLMLIAMNKFTIWDQLGAKEKFWTDFAIVYFFTLVASGYIYFANNSRVSGIIHVALMFGIAGFVLVGLMRGWVSSPGSDNAAAGIVAAANFVFVVAGGLAALCGIGVSCYALPRNQKDLTGD